LSKDWNNFVRERDDALLSLDKEQLLAYARKWGVNLSYIPKSDELFWVSIHKARTAATSLPIAARQESKRWLHERGYQSMDDGDVPL
jgi:hypothetical protein